MNRSVTFAATLLFFAAGAARAQTIDSISYAPGMGTWGMLMFEDSWPSNGDLDFNDQTIAYNDELALDANGMVTAIDASFNVLAAGASFHNGLYLRLPGVDPSTVASAKILDSQGNLTSAVIMTGETDLVVQVVADTRSLFTLQFPFLNTAPTMPTEAANAALRVQIIFTSGVALDTSTAPFDVFIARSTNYGWQIHLPQYPGTSAAMTWLTANKFGTGNDCSSGTTCTRAVNGRWFVNQSGLPFALDIPALIPWPKETVAISSAYPDIVAFGTSGGTVNTDWYYGTQVASDEFTTGASGSLPPTPIFAGSGDPFSSNKWVQVSGGLVHALALKDDGTVWAWGDNQQGQLGVGAAIQASETPVFVGSGFVFVSAGWLDSFAIKSDGSLWAWGNNANAQLGDGTETNAFLPEPIGAGFTSVAAGYLHTLALQSNGTLWAWGYNAQGELGDGTETMHTTAEQIGTDTWSTISAGQNSSAAIRSDHTLWTWGFNNSGQLGDGTNTLSISPEQIGTGTDYLYASAGGDDLLAVHSDGSLYACGDNSYGQVGIGSTASKTSTLALVGSGYSAQLVAGTVSSYALKEDATLWAWGYNGNNQLGDGADINISAPEQINGFSGPVAAIASSSNGAECAEAITSDGAMWIWGNGPVTPELLPIE